MVNIIIGLGALLSAYLGTATPLHFTDRFTMLISAKPSFTRIGVTPFFLNPENQKLSFAFHPIREYRRFRATFSRIHCIYNLQH